MEASSKGRKYDVLLAGYYGFGNLGDELLAQSALDFLLALGVGRERLAILSASASESGSRLGIQAFDRWSPSAVAGAIARSRSLLFAGGGLFQDASSARSPVYYWGLVRLAVLCSCRAWAIGQSVGPLSRTLSRRLTKDALGRLAYLGVRDDPSLGQVRELGLDAIETPDLVLGFSLPKASGRKEGSILVNIRPHPRNDCIDAVLAVSRDCADAGLRIRGVAFCEEDRRLFAEKISRGIMPECEIVLAKGMEDFLRISEDAFAAVGMRLHFGILSALRGLAVIMAPYDPKVLGFAERWKIPLLPRDFSGGGERVISSLTNAGSSDTKRFESSRAALSRHFAEGLNRVLEGGPNGQRGKG